MTSTESNKPTPEESINYYYDLSAAELAKLINDEYALILGNEIGRAHV